MDAGFQVEEYATLNPSGVEAPKEIEDFMSRLHRLRKKSHFSSFRAKRGIPLGFKVKRKRDFSAKCASE
jgi:hypothetical protein